MSDMELRLLRYFLAVAEELHFGRAARRLNISQPPLSQQIAKFEESLGVPLFIRNKRMVMLTEAGTTLVRHARAILSMVETARSDVSRVSLGVCGTMALGYVGPAMESFLPELILEFKRQYPEVTLKLNQLSTPDQLLQIRNRSIQAGIVRLFGQDTTGLLTQVIQKDTYVLAVPAHHGLAGYKKVALASLDKQDMLFFSRQIQPRTFDAWQKIFSDEGIIPNIVQQTSSYHSTIALVSAGLGIAIVPKASTLNPRKGVVFKSLEGQRPEIKLHLCCLEGATHPVLNNFRQVANQMGEF